MSIMQIFIKKLAYFVAIWHMYYKGLFAKNLY